MICGGIPNRDLDWTMPMINGVAWSRDLHLEFWTQQQANAGRRTFPSFPAFAGEPPQSVSPLRLSLSVRDFPEKIGSRRRPSCCWKQTQRQPSHMFSALASDPPCFPFLLGREARDSDGTLGLVALLLGQSQFTFLWHSYLD